MGADGHITIWRRDKALEAFPEADKLFELLPNCYQDKFEQAEIYHAYHGDNVYDDWRTFEGWSTRSEGYPPLERQLEFFRWLQANAFHQWEVWT
jgi:hypothetical protein